MFLTTFVEETTFYTSRLVPGSQWFNSRIGAPIAAVGSYVCAGGAAACHSVGWHTTGWKCMSGSAACTGYVMGAYRASPENVALGAARLATTPLSQGNAAGMV